jgi:hypothetical protein
MINTEYKLCKRTIINMNNMTQFGQLQDPSWIKIENMYLKVILGVQIDNWRFDKDR